MKSFTFKLDSVLNLRERAKKQAQLLYAEAGRQLEAALEEHRAALAEEQRIADSIAELQRATFRPAEREMLWKALAWQRDSCAQLLAAVDAARKELESKREALLSARREHEAMLRLREKQLTAWQRDAQLAEIAMIDDIVNARHAALRSVSSSGSTFAPHAAIQPQPARIASPADFTTYGGAA
jgi:flagellar export protein FliJ